MYKIEKPAIPEVTRKVRGAMEHVYMFEGMDDVFRVSHALQGEGKLHERKAVDWNDRCSTTEAMNKCVTGDLASAAKSEALLAGLEKFLHLKASRFTTIEDVAGGVPNVPAYLAGHPVAMRRRARVQDELAPLTVVIDITSSAGINAAKLNARGAAVLALVRALASARPVKLVAMIPLGLSEVNGGRDAFRLMVPIETAPLDLARAAYALAHQGFPRALGYALIHALNGLGPSASGKWCYNNVEVERNTQTATLKTLYEGEIFSIAAPHGNDTRMDNPEKWLLDNVRRFGGLVDA